MTGMPRGVTHSTAEPVWEMSRALSVSQRCRDGHRAQGGRVWGATAEAGAGGR